MDEMLKKAKEYANSDEDNDHHVPFGIDGMDRMSLLKIIHYLYTESKGEANEKLL